MRQRPTQASPRVSLRAAAGLLVAAAAVLSVAPATARVPTEDSPSPLIRQHLAGDGKTAHAAGARARASHAQVARADLQPCEEAGPDGLCGTVEVPLDRDDPSAGTVPIFFLFYPHRDPGPANEAILVTAGGPGFSLISEPGAIEYHRGVFDPLLDTRDLIFLDQRGVGHSNAIDCPTLQHGSGDPYNDIAACAELLGSAASLYTSGAVALDIEAVRKALRIKKLDFYGGSYAAVDIQSYAVRFPHRLRSAVLDSPATVTPYDFDVTTVQAINRAVRLICERSRSCSKERDDALESVAWLAHRLRRDPVEGVGLDSLGQPHELTVDEGFLIWRILNTDFGGFASDSEIAAAADALRAGDPVPLLRLAAEGDGPFFGDEGDPTSFSAGHNFARYCTEQPMPWDKDASVSTRLRQWQEARDELSRHSVAPYSVDAWLAPAPTGPFGPDLCIAWPPPERDIEPAIPEGAEFPGDVPAFVLSGDLDFVTPTADARQLADSWPNSRFVEIANSGHHTMVDGRFECSGSMVVNFIAELEPGDTECASDTRFNLIPSVGRFALTAADARPAKRRKGDESNRKDRKVATVATAAVTDAIRRTFLTFPPAPGPGLRGGTFSSEFAPDGNGLITTLDGARFASDVAVTGTSNYAFETEEIDATITVDGPHGKDGELHVTGVWAGVLHEATVLEVQGELGGRSIAVRVPAT